MHDCAGSGGRRLGAEAGWRRPGALGRLGAAALALLDHGPLQRHVFGDRWLSSVDGEPVSDVGDLYGRRGRRGLRHHWG